MRVNHNMFLTRLVQHIGSVSAQPITPIWPTWIHIYNRNADSNNLSFVIFQIQMFLNIISASSDMIFCFYQMNRGMTLKIIILNELAKKNFDSMGIITTITLQKPKKNITQCMVITP